MLASLRRAYLYVVTAGAFLFTLGVLQNFLHALLRRGGLEDYLGQGAPAGSDFTQALTLALADLIVVLVGAVHWYFIWRELRAEPALRGGAIRAVFVAGLLAVTGLVTTFSAASVVGGLASPDPNQHGFVAVPLAGTIAWGLGLALIVLERQATVLTGDDARLLANIFAYIPQWVLLIAAIVFGVQFVQSWLQDAIAPLPACGPGNVAFTCGYSATLASLLQAVVALAGLGGFAFLTRHDANTPTRLISDSITVLIGLITTLVGVIIGAQLVLYLAKGAPDVLWPQSLLSNQVANYPQMGSQQYLWLFPFVGPLLAGALTLGGYVGRAIVRTGAAELAFRRVSRQVMIIVAALPLAAVFITGGATLLGDALVAVRGHAVTLDDWVIAWSLLIGGAAWAALWPLLAAMSNPSGAGPSVPRRVYELILLAATVVVGVISLAVGIYVVLSGVLGSSADLSGDAAARAFGVALATGAVAGYYVFVVQRDNRLLRQHAPAPAPVPAAPAGGEAPTLERVLDDVAAGRLPVIAAAGYLRTHPEIR